MADQRQWLIKAASGRVTGPHGFAAIMKMISSGQIVGDEEISQVPGNKWVLISSEPAFYDRILDRMENPDLAGAPEEFDSSLPRESLREAETIISPNPLLAKPPAGETSSDLSSRNSENTKPGLTEESPAYSLKANNVSLHHPSPQAQSHLQKASEPSDKPPVIDLVTPQSLTEKDRAKQKRVAVSILALALLIVIVGIIFLDEGEGEGAKISLIAPSRADVEISEQNLKSRLIEAQRAIQKDSFSGYREAQNTLVSLIEGAQRSLDLKELLCLVYKELWPYAYQDNHDLKAVAFVAQTTKAIDPTSRQAKTCEIVMLLVNGKYREAKGVLDQALTTYSDSALLLALKADIFIIDKDHLNAEAYARAAVSLRGNWLKTRMLLGLANEGLGEFNKAAEIYREILNLNPAHKPSRLRLGVLEARQFRRPDKALEILQPALNSKERALRLEEGRAYAALAEVLFAQGESSAAKKAAQAAYTINPNSSEYRQLYIKLGGLEEVTKKGAQGNSEQVYLGDEFMRTGDYFSAQAEYKAAFEADPKNALAATKAAKSLWALNQSADATDYLHKAIKADPSYLPAYVALADYLSQRHDYAGAIRILNQSKAISSNGFETAKGMAIVEQRRNNAKGALSLAQRAARINDTDPEIYVIMSKAYLSANQHKEAINAATRALELDGSNVQAHVVYARALRHFQGMEMGVAYLRDLINKNQYISDYRIALADLLRGEEKAKEAEVFYRQVAEVEPTNKQAWIGLGESKQALGLMDEAISAYLQAATLDPADAEALFKAAILYLETGRFQLAIQQLDRVVKVNPHYPRAYYFTGKAAYLQGDYKKAIDAAMQERKQNPNIADSYILAAEIYSAAKEYSNCAREYQKAIKLRSQGAEMYVKIARCHRLSDNLEVADSMLSIAASKESGYPDIYKEKGALFQRQGDVKGALLAYDKYLALSPNAPDKKEIEAQIRSLEGR